MYIIMYCMYVFMLCSGVLINNLRFADDIDLMAESEDKLQELTTRVHESSKRFGLKINGEKTKTMTIGKKKEKISIRLGGEELEQVKEFVYLGGVITEDAEMTKDIMERVGTSVGNVREAEETMEIKQHINQNKN